MDLELTPQEKKIVERLRKQQRQWPRMRWFVLGTGIFAVLCSGLVGIEFTRHIDTMLAPHDSVVARAWLLGFAAFWPTCLLLFGFGVFFIIWACRDWHGNPDRVLVLRLLDAHQEDASV